MPTTTNFGWTTPADTDLVKDGAAAIRTLAGNIDTSLVDLKGGTTGQVLAKASNTDLDFNFTTIASSALTKITSASFTAQSSVAIDDVFTSTYKMYYVNWYAFGSVAAADIQLQFRYAGPTTQATDYNGAGFGYQRGNSLVTYGYASATQTTLYTDLGTSAGESSFGDLTFSNVGNASEQALYYGNGYGRNFQSAIVYSGYVDVARIYTGFLLKPSSGTITGYYRVYGLAN